MVTPIIPVWRSDDPMRFASWRWVACFRPHTMRMRRRDHIAFVLLCKGGSHHTNNYVTCTSSPSENIYRGKKSGGRM